MTHHALLVIDVQESFRHLARWAGFSHPDIVGAANRLVAAARAAGDLVVWVLHAEPGSGTPFDPASGHVRLMDGLTALPGEPVITKQSRNAFTTTALAQILTARGITDLAVCGIQTEQCCETTTRVAGDLGYQVDFVTEATGTFPVPHRDAPVDRPWSETAADPRTLGVEEIIERTEYALAGRFATIRTIAQVEARAAAPAP